MKFSHALVLVIIPTSLLLTGCTTAPADVLSKAAEIQATATARVEEIQQGVTNVVAGVEQARDDLLEKKRQLEQAVTDVNTAIDSVDTLLGKKETTAANTTTDTPTTTDLEAQKKALEATLAEAQKALAALEAKAEAAK